MEITAHKPEVTNAESRVRNPYLGVGLYSIPEAARLLGLRAGKLRRWAESYTFRSHRRGGSAGLLFERDEPAFASHKILTFVDLIELHMIDLLRKEKVSMPTIRAAAWLAADLYHTPHPLASKRFHTEGKRIFSEVDCIPLGEDLPQPSSKDLCRYQFALETVAAPFFSKLDYECEEVRYYWPMGREKGVVLDPARSFGEPVDVWSGVPTATLYQLATAGESVERIAHWYEVKKEAVAAAIEFEQSLTA